jgi:hypothetical protein
VIRIGVVIDRPAENVDSDGAFFQILLATFESSFDNMLEEAAVPFAVPKNGVARKSRTRSNCSRSSRSTMFGW